MIRLDFIEKGMHYSWIMIVYCWCICFICYYFVSWILIHFLFLTHLFHFYYSDLSFLFLWILISKFIKFVITLRIIIFILPSNLPSLSLRLTFQYWCPPSPSTHPEMLPSFALWYKFYSSKSPFHFCFYIYPFECPFYFFT